MPGFYCLGVENFYLLIHPNGHIFAAGALWNQQSFKQNIIKKYHGIYNAASKFSFLLRLFRYPPLPKINTIAGFAYISFLTAENNNPNIIRAFLGEIMAAAGKQYETVCIGATENSETSRILKKIKSIHFNSNLCLLDFKKDDTWIKLCTGPAFFECGSL